MKTSRKICLLLLAVLLIIPFADVDAQKRKRRKKDEPKAISSYIDVYGGGGYSALLHSIDGTSVPGGGAGMLGFGYLMKHKSNFNFSAGLEFMFLNSTTKLDPMTYMGQYNYTSDYVMDFSMDFADYKEAQNRMSLNIPILFGAQFKDICFLAGAKMGLGLMGNYTSKFDLTSRLTDKVMIEDMLNMPNHGLGTFDMKSKGKLKYGFDVAVSAEVGLCLDRWMPADAKEFGGGKDKREISYRVGVFADYGLLDINSNAKEGDMILTKDNTEGGDGKTVKLENIPNFNANSILNSDRAIDKALNSLVVGAKFTVLFGVDKAPKPVKKKPRRRPKVREVSFIPDPTYFYLFVNDFETEEPLDATVKVYTLGEKVDTIFTGVTDKETGFIEEQIDNGQYGISITRPGYIDYNDTLFSVISDTLYVDLQPIKKNTVVILRNLLFDTDKTTIRNISAPSLEELYQLLAQNPNMRIRITGHTDNVGSERYNKKLSEGRAKAVFDEMVKRGIDPSRMEWNGRGSKEPIESNKTAEGRAENRRVEFKILNE
ncbi:MAG: OmpA family protein [Paludibacteraceae bacterium]|nr:OmpA family protein [Paludibacteraceae bacterium]